MNNEELLYIDEILDNLDSYSDDMEELANDMIVSILNNIKDSDKSELIEYICKKYSNISTIAEEIGLKDNLNMQKAYYLGFMKAVIDINNLANKKRKQSKYINKFIPKYKYLEDIIYILYHENIMTHSQIADKLKINANVLTNFFTRTENLNIFDSKKNGKYKYYYLTSIGREYYIVHCERRNNKVSAESYTNYLVNLLDVIETEIKSPVGNVENAKNLLTNYEYKIYLTKPKLFCDKFDNLINYIGKQKEEYCFRSYYEYVYSGDNYKDNDEKEEYKVFEIDFY